MSPARLCRRLPQILEKFVDSWVLIEQRDCVSSSHPSDPHYPSATEVTAVQARVRRRVARQKSLQEIAMQRWLKLALVAVLSGCNLSVTEGPPAMRTGDVVRVLFIGNSLTYSNDMPAIVEALADSAGVKGLAWGMI